MILSSRCMGLGYYLHQSIEHDKHIGKEKKTVASTSHDHVLTDRTVQYTTSDRT